MQQRRIYLEETYQFSAGTRVIDTGGGELGHWLGLADNIFHPQGGGQPSDLGTAHGLRTAAGQDQGRRPEGRLRR